MCLTASREAAEAELDQLSRAGHAKSQYTLATLLDADPQKQVREGGLRRGAGGGGVSDNVMMLAVRPWSVSLWCRVSVVSGCSSC